MPPFTTPREMGGGFTVDKLIMDSPAHFAAHTHKNFFRNRVGSQPLSSLFLRKKINKKEKKRLQ